MVRPRVEFFFPFFSQSRDVVMEKSMFWPARDQSDNFKIEQCISGCVDEGV